jgi:hypothetical protein
MTSEECHERASQCAANAGAAVDPAVAMEFLKMAAQWRTMAVRMIFMGSIDVAAETPVPGALTPRLI